MKKYIFTLVFSSGFFLGTAQTAAQVAPVKNPDELFNIMSIVLFSIVGIISVIALYFMVRVNQMLTRELLATKYGAIEPAQTHEVAASSQFWQNLKRKYWEDAVPIEREGEVMMHHSYDGIRELDNSLPPWWVNLFYITIAFSVVYMYWFHFGGPGISQAKEYELAIEEGNAIKAKAIALQASTIDESNLKLMTSANDLAEGELVYKNLCTACHGQNGEGGVGPNMTDNYWLHGGSIQNVYNTIKVGVPDKGMIAWSNQLRPADMLKVASFIKSLGGTNPPNPKAPQGIEYKEDTAPVKDAKSNSNL